MLSGMGVPDLRGGFGTATLYSSSDDARALEGERLVKVADGTDGPIATEIIGPAQPQGPLRPHVPDRPSTSTRSPGPPRSASKGPRRAWSSREGGWSDWLRVALQGRACSRRSGGSSGSTSPRSGRRSSCTPRRSTSTRNPPPSRSAIRPSSPARLAEELGPFHTTGMVEDHGGLNNGRIDEHAYLDQCDLAWREREAMLLRSLDRLRRRACSTACSTPPTASSTCSGGIRDPAHPLHEVDPDDGRGDRGPVPPVGRDGRPRPRSRPTTETLVIALSDHGFGPFRRAVHLNTWLLENGLLALKAGPRARRSGRRPAPRGRLVEDEGVLARPGRDLPQPPGARGRGDRRPGRGRVGSRPRSPGGSVGCPTRSTARPRSGASSLARRSTPARTWARRPTCSSTSRRVTGPRRVPRWAVSPSSVFEDNRKKWSGDHIVDPALVPWRPVPRPAVPGRKRPGSKTWPRRSSRRSASPRGRPWKGVR